MTWEAPERVPARLEVVRGRLENLGWLASHGLRSLMIVSATTSESSSEEAIALLTHGSRVHGRDVRLDDARVWLKSAGRHVALDHVIPPFAAVRLNKGTGAIRAAVDWLGLRQMYYVEGAGWAALSTSSIVLATLSDAAVDLDAVSSLSLLGWQLGDATVYQGVKCVPPGGVLSLTDGSISLVQRAMDPIDAPRSIDEAARTAAGLISREVNALLDDNPTTTLQLTGGLDSRILLAAVPSKRRGSLSAMTLAVGESPDVAIAARLSARDGLRHLVVAPGELETPAEVHSLALAAAHRLDSAADPLTGAGLALAEARAPQSPRLSGLGGEVVRGFYYLGGALPARTSRRKVKWLADWRLFPNESVPGLALADAFRHRRMEVTLATLDGIFSEMPTSWPTATDEFYLWHRMRRWAGTTTTSTCWDRLVINPMLSTEFVQLGRSIPASWKSNAQFLSRILVELDPELARIPLDGRPSPQVYARGGLATSARLAQLTATKAASKIHQRLAQRRHSQTGDTGIANMVLRDLQAHPDLLDVVRQLRVFDDGVLDDLLKGRATGSATTVALLVSLEAATAQTW